MHITIQPPVGYLPVGNIVCMSWIMRHIAAIIQYIRYMREIIATNYFRRFYLSEYVVVGVVCGVVLTVLGLGLGLKCWRYENYLRSYSIE